MNRLRAFFSALRLFKRVAEHQRVLDALCICEGCGTVLYRGRAHTWRGERGPVQSCGNCRPALLKRFPVAK